MVCIPCIIAPVMLFIWYRFIQPLVLKFWNPWAPKPAIHNSASTATNTKETESACPFSSLSKKVGDTTDGKELAGMVGDVPTEKELTEMVGDVSTEKELADKKID